MRDPRFPERIVCMTEETTEWFYLLGEEHRIVGISGFTARPWRARREKPRVSAFTSANIEKILDLRPDLAIGFSDLQADIARDLARAGVNVLLTNQRSVQEIFDTLLRLAALVGAEARGRALLADISASLDAVRATGAAFPRRPRVYFEEWPDPMISGIRWVSELIGIAGGEDCFPELAQAQGAKDRIIANPEEVVARNPDVIIGSWCGRKFRPEKVIARPGWDRINAVRDGAVHEIKSTIILQPGPACLTDGVQALHGLLGQAARAN